MLEHNGKIVKGEGFLVDDLTERAMDYMEAKKDEPFFRVFAFEYAAFADAGAGSLVEEFDGAELGLEARPQDKENLQHTRAALAMCENIDWNVGRVTQKIEDLGLSDNTIVIYFSDNGPNGYRWNADMKGKKGQVDEGGVRSPFFIRWPGHIPAGGKSSEITGAIDLLPTLSDLAGIQKYDTLPLDGLSLKPLLLGKGEKWSDRMYVNYFRGKTSIRSKEYRLDEKGVLYDMVADPGQRVDVSDKFPAVAKRMRTAQKNFNRDVVSELGPKSDVRPFTIGHKDFDFTQMPARDGVASGGIERSGRAPNCSFFTHWTSLEDRITWNAEVLESGDYQVQVYYTCPEKDLGARFELSHGKSTLEGKVTVAHDSPMMGMEDDRFLRAAESYVKDFAVMDMGVMRLEKGKNPLVLRALEIPGSQVMEMRLLMFNRVAQ